MSVDNFFKELKVEKSEDSELRMKSSIKIALMINSSGQGSLVEILEDDLDYIALDCYNEFFNQPEDYFSSFTEYSAGLYLAESTIIDTSGMTACGWEYDCDLETEIVKPLFILDENKDKLKK